MAVLFALSTAFAAVGAATGAPPFRGWRSWIALVHEADQAAMEAAMLALAKPRGPAGKSLASLGYTDAGLDGGWAMCTGVNGSYHDAHGDLIVNKTKFHSFAAMTARAHSLNLTASWYLNCDQCSQTEALYPSAVTDAWYGRDAAAAAALGFDGVKFDTQPSHRGPSKMGPNWNISLWSEAVRATLRPMLIEDCLDKHPDGAPLKNSDHPSIDILHDPAYCPVDFYRVGGDNMPVWNSGMKHVFVDALPFLEVTAPVRASRPGCWAYLDMLGIGKSVMQQSWAAKGCKLLGFDEERALFAAWAVLSSPLVLSFDVTDDAEVDRLWPIIANERALAINAAWAGEAGHLLKRSAASFNASGCGALAGPDAQKPPTTLPLWGVFAKRLGGGRVAILALNVADARQTIEVAYTELLRELGQSGAAGPIVGTDVWSGSPTAKVTQTAPWSVDLAGHSSAFAVFRQATEPW